jgi:hypothetical protein
VARDKLKETLMPDDVPSEQHIWQAALRPGENCLPVEQLEKLVLEDSAPALAEHVRSCAYCTTQLQLLREFSAGNLKESETEAVQLITARLRERSDEIFGRPGVPGEAPETWWKTLWRTPWLRPAALALAGLSIVVVLSLQMRISPPGIRPPSPEQEVLRSNTISILAPAGDVREVPNEIRWQAAPNAVRYQARLLQVDGAELWKGETATNAIGLPSAIRARVVPAKTLLCQVLAFDASGKQVGQSDTVRFRLLQ